MPRITFIQPDGAAITLPAEVGDSVMDCALDHQVPGIGGQCGGGCTCSTCHCYVAAAWLSRLEPAHFDEEELLGYIPERRPNSRLGCQITMTAALDGLVVHVPAAE